MAGQPSRCAKAAPARGDPSKFRKLSLTIHTVGASVSSSHLYDQMTSLSEKLFGVHTLESSECRMAPAVASVADEC